MSFDNIIKYCNICILFKVLYLIFNMVVIVNIIKEKIEFEI